MVAEQDANVTMSLCWHYFSYFSPWNKIDFTPVVPAVSNKTLKCISEYHKKDNIVNVVTVNRKLNSGCWSYSQLIKFVVFSLSYSK